MKKNQRKARRVSLGEYGEEGGCSFENGRPRSRGWKNFWRRWTRGVKNLKNILILIYL